jgi:hypothetical protein
MMTSAIPTAASMDPPAASPARRPAARIIARRPAEINAAVAAPGAGGRAR